MDLPIHSEHRGAARSGFAFVTSDCFVPRNFDLLLRSFERVGFDGFDTILHSVQNLLNPVPQATQPKSLVLSDWQIQTTVLVHHSCQARNVINSGFNIHNRFRDFSKAEVIVLNDKPNDVTIALQMGSRSP